MAATVERVSHANQPSFLKELFVVGPPAGAHRVAARAALSIAVPLLVLISIHQEQWAPYAAFGAFTSLYGRRKGYAERAGMQLSAAVTMTLCCVVGALTALLPHHQWWMILTGVLVALTTTVASDVFGWHPPGALFPLFAATVSAMGPPSAQNVLAALVVCGLSGAFATLVGHLGVLRERKDFGLRLPHTSVRNVLRTPGMPRELLLLGLTLALSGLIGSWWGHTHSYWAMVAASAAFSGPHRRARFIRGVHRVIGTLLGVVAAWPILSMHPRGVWAVVVIVLLQSAAELFVGRNYALALIAITPLALMMGQLVHEQHVPTVLADRAVETVIGATLALIALCFLPKRART